MRIRFLAAFLPLLLLAACSGNALPGSTTTGALASTSSVPAGSTTTESTAGTSTTAGTTTTTFPGSYAVEQVDACVIGAATGDEVNLRSAPGSENDLVGTLAAHDTGVHTTGWAARDADGDEWRQINLTGDTAWVFSAFLTPGACTVGEPGQYCVNEEACTDAPNLRAGLGSGYQVIDTLPPDAVEVGGTGITALDGLDRPWVQVEYDGQVGWVAGWLLDAAPCEPAACAVEFTLHPDGIDGWRLGDGFDQVREGLIALLGEPEYEDEVPGPGDEPYYEIGWDGLYVSLNHDSGFAGYEYWGAPSLEGKTPEGVGLGASFSDLEAAYPLGEWVPPAECVEREGGFIAPSITAAAWYEFLFSGDDPARSVASVRVGFVNEWC